MHKKSNELSPNVSSYNAPLFSDKELNELEEYVTRKMEPEPEKHVKIIIRPSVIRSATNLPLNEIEDDDPDYISNLILMYDNKETPTRNIYSMTTGSTLDHESIFNRYEIPFYSSKTNFKNNVVETKNDTQNDNDSLSNHNESNDEKAKIKNAIGVIFFIFWRFYCFKQKRKSEEKPME